MTFIPKSKEHGLTIIFGQVWYFLTGQGEVWRRLDGREEITPVRPGISLNIPLGAEFQFRNPGTEPLAFLIVTMPPLAGRDGGRAGRGALAFGLNNMPLYSAGLIRYDGGDLDFHLRPVFHLLQWSAGDRQIKA